jgi:hypothetical protein
MKPSTARKTKKTDTARLITYEELKALTLEVYRYREGWIVVDGNDDDEDAIHSTHRTQAKAAEKARALAKKRGGRLLVHGRNGRIRKKEYYWSEPVRVEPPKYSPLSYPPVNATRKAIHRAVMNAIRRAKAEAIQQVK